jgi:hypothetical protein
MAGLNDWDNRRPWPTVSAFYEAPSAPRTRGADIAVNYHEPT